MVALWTVFRGTRLAGHDLPIYIYKHWNIMCTYAKPDIDICNLHYVKTKVIYSNMTTRVCYKSYKSQYRLHNYIYRVIKNTMTEMHFCNTYIIMRCNTLFHGTYQVFLNMSIIKQHTHTHTHTHTHVIHFFLRKQIYGGIVLFL